MATTLADASAPAAASAAPPRRASYRFLLLFRFGILNLTGFALLGAIWMQGWLDPLFEAVSLTHMCKLIFVLLLVGLARAGREVGRLSFDDRHEVDDLAHTLGAEEPGDENGGSR